MSFSSRAGFSVSGSNDTIIKNRPIGYFGVSPSIVNLQFAHSKSKEFMGKPIEFSDQKILSNWNAKASRHNPPINAQASICISRGLRWWEKTLVLNMIEIHSAQELVGSLLNAGDRLVIIDFYSPGCGGCKALHPKDIASGKSILLAPRLPDEYAVWLGEIKPLSYFKERYMVSAVHYTDEITKVLHQQCQGYEKPMLSLLHGLNIDSNKLQIKKGGGGSTGHSLVSFLLATIIQLVPKKDGLYGWLHHLGKIKLRCVASDVFAMTDSRSQFSSLVAGHRKLL